MEGPSKILSWTIENHEIGWRDVPPPTNYHQWRAAWKAREFLRKEDQLHTMKSAPRQPRNLGESTHVFVWGPQNMQNSRLLVDRWRSMRTRCDTLSGWEHGNFLWVFGDRGRRPCTAHDCRASLQEKDMSSSVTDSCHCRTLTVGEAKSILQTEKRRVKVRQKELVEKREQVLGRKGSDASKQRAISQSTKISKQLKARYERIQEWELLIQEIEFGNLPCWLPPFFYTHGS